jgi:hypothetical protein
MDLLSKRYASPCFLLNGVISTGRLDEFVEEFAATELKEQEDKTNWEFFLHKVFDKSYSEFIEEMETQKKHQNMSERTIETTLNHTQNILNRFNPEQQGGE